MATHESLADRAAELSIEQLERLADFLKTHTRSDSAKFYADPFEAGISNQIARLMARYAASVNTTSVSA